MSFMEFSFEQGGTHTLQVVLDVFLFHLIENYLHETFSLWQWLIPILSIYLLHFSNTI